MTHDPSNPFSEFDGEFRDTPAAKQGMGRLPAGTYKFMCISVDSGDGTFADSELIDNSDKGKSKGIKIFAEVVHPEKIGEEKVKGKDMEHVFWVTVKNLPYIKRDIATILGREVSSLTELLKHGTWAGKTFEGVVREETYDNRINAKIAFINPWRPGVETKLPPSIRKEEPAKSNAGESLPF